VAGMLTAAAVQIKWVKLGEICALPKKYMLTELKAKQSKAKAKQCEFKQA